MRTDLEHQFPHKRIVIRLCILSDPKVSFLFISAELFEGNTECIIKQSPERNAIIKQCLQLVEHIIQKGKLAAENFERQNGHILQHPEASSVRLIRKGVMRTSSVSMESDTSTQADSNDFENENRPMGLLNFSGAGEETPFTSRNDSME